jgi:hypothetical protein
MNNTHGPHICDICQKDLALEIEYFWCTECPATFYWCLPCFYTTRASVNSVEDRLPAPNRYGGRVITSTRDSHIHTFCHYKLDIRCKPNTETKSPATNKRPRDQDTADLNNKKKKIKSDKRQEDPDHKADQNEAASKDVY